MPPLDLQLIDMSSIEALRERSETVNQRSCQVVEVDECTAAPRLHPTGDQSQFRFVQALAAEELPAKNERVRAVKIVPPAVEWADEPLTCTISAPFYERNTAMTTS